MVALFSRLFLPCVPILFAVMALAGWIFDIDWLKRSGLHTTTMNPMTASCFVVLGTSVLFARFPSKAPDLEMSAGWRRSSTLALLGLVIGAGALKLIDLVTSNYIGIDAILFASELSHQDVPSRMAPNAALCFVMIGVSLTLLLCRPEKFVLSAQLLALATGLTAGFAVLGYLFGVPSLYRIPAFIPMAFHTALSFECLSAYVLVTTRHHALMTPISDRGAGGRTARRLMPLAIVLPVAAGWFPLMGEQSGLYTPTVGVTIMVTVNLLIFAAVIWWNARQLLASEYRRRLAEAELTRAATHDFLTGLANRGLFMGRLDARLAAFRRRHSELFAVIYMDLDGFKQVNDRLGHGAGDELLCQVADLLRGCVRSDDLVARMGGDEFTMLLDRISGPDDPKHIASRILQGMPREFGVSENLVPVGISIGIVISEIGHHSAEALLHDADAALYRSKQDGKNRFSMHSAQI